MTPEMVVQGGALLLLSYLVVWGTKSGAPKLFEALTGIRVAIEANNQKLDSFEETNRQLVSSNRQLVMVVSKLARESQTVGEHTIQMLEKHVGGSDEASPGRSRDGG